MSTGQQCLYFLGVNAESLFQNRWQVNTVSGCDFKQPDKLNLCIWVNLSLGEFALSVNHLCLDCAHSFFSLFFMYCGMVWKAEKVMLLHRSYQPKPAGWWLRFSPGPAELSGLWPSDAQPAAWLWLLWKPPLQGHQVTTSLLHLHLLMPLPPLHPPHHLWLCLLVHLLAMVGKGQKITNVQYSNTLNYNDVGFLHLQTVWVPRDPKLMWKDIIYTFS